MADKTPEADLANQFGAFAKSMDDVQKNIKAMAGPLKAMADTMKAVSMSSKDVAEHTKKIKEDEEKTSEHKKQHIDSTLKELNIVTELVLKKGELTEAGEEIRRQTESLIKQALDMKQHHQDVASLYAKQAKETAEHNAALYEQVSIWDRIGKSINAAWEKNVMMRSKAMATASASSNEFMFGKGVSSADQAVAKIGGSVAGLIPAAGGIGGLLGVILYGMQKDAEFAAIGESARQVFDKVGEGAGNLASKLSGATRDLSVRGIIDKTDLANTAEAFANLGFHASDVEQKVEGFKYGVNNLATASLSMDKALEAPAGTMAKLGGTMAQMFNTSLGEGIKSLWSIGSAAEKAGGNMASFMQQTVEAASALRMLNANGDTAVGGMQLGLMKKYGAGGFSDQTAQARAAAGTANAMQGIAGLDVGMSAVIGEKLNLGSGLDAWYAMKGGDSRSGGSNLKIEDVVKELAKVATDTTGNRSEQVYMLMQLTGTQKEGAEAILDANKEILENGKMSTDAQKKMNMGFQTEGQKTSRIVIALEMIKDGFAHIGSGMLVVIVNTLKMIYHAIMGLGNKISSYFAGTEGEKKAADRAYDLHMEAATNAASHITGKSGTERVMSGLSKLGDGAKDLGDLASLGTGWRIATDDASSKDMFDSIKDLAPNTAGIENRKMVLEASGNALNAGTLGLAGVARNLYSAASGLMEYMSSKPGDKDFKEGKKGK